jgi:hypothetical protein
MHHIPGRHCASTALCNATYFHGAPLSEAMCFGLGEGLGIFYIGLPGLAPSRLAHVRSLEFERQFFERIGIPFQWDQHNDPMDSEKALRAVLDAGRPALIQTDIYYLPYYQSKTHFAGHLITVWGYDVDRQIFFVTDTEREEVFEVPFDAMRRARYCKMPPFPMEGNLFAPEAISLPPDLPRRIWAAIVSNSARLVSADAAHEGLNALRSWQADLKDWPSFADWQWTARLAYQTIMKRGTGGGGFRLMYADFLREAAPNVPEIGLRGLAEKMQCAGEAWDGFAAALRDLSDRESPDDLAGVAHSLNNVLHRESAYHDAVLRSA